MARFPTETGRRAPARVSLRTLSRDSDNKSPTSRRVRSRPIAYLLSASLCFRALFGMCHSGTMRDTATDSAELIRWLAQQVHAAARRHHHDSPVSRGRGPVPVTRVLGRAVVESSKPREQNETPLERRQAAQLARAHGLWGQLEANTYRGSEPPTLTVRFTQRPHGSSTPKQLTVRVGIVTPEATFRPAGWGAALMLRTKPALDGSP